jgi:hypothetical protein
MTESQIDHTLRWLPRWVWAVVVLCGAAASTLILQVGFTDDDFIQLWNTRHPLGESLMRAMTAPDMFADTYFRPVTRIVHRFLFEIFGGHQCGTTHSHWPSIS